MKNLILSLLASLLALSANAQWFELNGMAFSWDSFNESSIGIDVEDRIAFNSSALPILNTAGDYRLVVDGKYVTLTGIASGGSWVTSPVLDRDVYTAIQMLKNGKHAKLQYCEVGHKCMDIYSSTLKGSTKSINQIK